MTRLQFRSNIYEFGLLTIFTILKFITKSLKYKAALKVDCRGKSPMDIIV